MRLTFLFFSFILLHKTQCAKILGIFPLPGKSHYILASSLMKGLAEKGHDVTVISPFGEKDPPKNGTYRDIILTSNPSENGDHDLFVIDKLNFVTYQLMMNYIGNQLSESTLSHPNVQKFLKSDEKFDVVIVEQFVNDALKVFAHHYKAPLVIFSTCGSNSWVNPLVANPAPPSYVPEQNINFDSQNFLDRLKNTIIYVFGVFNRQMLFFPEQNRIMKKYFPDAPDLDILNYNASLVLLNSHLSTNMAVPRVPNMIDIGGFHLKPAKKLPKDLQDYLDSAKDGVIYFSMGSNLQAKNLPAEKRDALLRVFSKLKEKVLWKFEDENLPGQSENVKIAKWLPQQDVLAHPNIKVFVTHGGLLSLIESVYNGIPILAIPVFGDQVWNAAEAAWNGLGRYILYGEVDEEKFSEALNDVLTNAKYRDNMKRRSKIMHDRRHAPIDEADYWIQYVIRHQGATHLRVAGLQLKWYQYISLDVTIFIFVMLSLAIHVLYLFLKLIVSKLRKKTNVRRMKKD